MPNFLDQKCGPQEVKDSVLHIEDVALYVLKLLSSSEKEVSSMKLQKICFYVQGWYAAKNGRNEAERPLYYNCTCSYMWGYWSHNFEVIFSY